MRRTRKEPGGGRYAPSRDRTMLTLRLYASAHYLNPYTVGNWHTWWGISSSSLVIMRRRSLSSGDLRLARCGLVLTLRPPLEAYHADLSALPGRSALGSADGIWIVVASGFWRLAQLPADARPAYARSHAAIVRAAIPEGEGAENESAQHDRAIAAGIADALERWEDGGSVERLAEL